MKARVIATGYIVDVELYYITPRIKTYTDGSQYYKGDELDFNVEYADPNYWTRLEHQYAGMAMQAYIIASHISQFSFCEGDMKDCKSIAHALVEELKKKEERK